jgi:mannose/fructose/sorbose-specific phosphotransferase system IIA component
VYTTYVPTILVLTHGPLAAGLMGSARMILGDQVQAEVMSFEPGEGPEDLTERLREVCAAADGGVLCLTDIQGGTPARTAASMVLSEHIEVVCGVNLPMLLEVLTMATADLTLAELTHLAVPAGRDSVVDLGASLRAVLDQQ